MGITYGDHLLDSGYHDIRSAAEASRNARVQRLRLNKYFPVNLFDFHGHVAVQSEKIETYQALHAQYPQRQGHYRDRVTSQLRAAA